MLNRNVQKNPFYHPPRQWQISVFVEQDVTLAIEDVFEDVALASSSFVLVEDGPDWRVDIISDKSPEEIDIAARLALVSGQMNIETPAYEVRELETKDWVSEVERSFAPLAIGRFYVHGSHVKAHPCGKIPLLINAGMAFGSGEHATTSGCLLALGLLAKRKRFSKTLDMGCGSGILSLAMAKLWHTKSMGIDIDPVSVTVARENAHKNQMRQFTHYAAADGYQARLVRQHAPYDLIVANILARPLIKMAPLLAKNLAPKGVAVLSGLLVRQEVAVLRAHRIQGLKLVSRIRMNGWSALILQK